MINQLCTQIVIPVLSTLLIALAGILATQLKNMYQVHVNNETKKEVVETCVKAAEQIYNSLNGTEKLEKVKKNAVEILNSKNIKITELELDMLVESVVASFNKNFE